MEQLELRVSVADGWARLEASGELDLSSAAAFATALNSAVQLAHAGVIVDVRGMTFCDSTGVREFLRVGQTCLDRGLTMRVVNPQAVVRRVFEVSGVADVLEVSDE